MVSNNFDARARALLIRYAGRNRVEDGLGIRGNCFHLDCLASAVRLNGDVAVALTVLAHGGYRWWATRLHGCDNAKPKQLYRKCGATGGQRHVHADRLVVRFDKRAHHPILREAALDKGGRPIPGLRHLPVVCESP